jgi:hypothetical protein
MNKKKMESVFSKNGKKTAIDGGKPTFHTSKTYGGTIPYLPGKFREELGEEIVKDTEKVKEKNTKKSKK